MAIDGIGRPSKYNDDMPQKLIDFFNRDLFVEIEGKKYPNKLPTIERYCFEIGITTKTFYVWLKKYPALSSAFSSAKQLQKDQIIQLGLMGFYKEGFAKFVALNVTDMKDRIDNQVDISKVSITIDKTDNDL